MLRCTVKKTRKRTVVAHDSHDNMRMSMLCVRTSGHDSQQRTSKEQHSSTMTINRSCGDQHLYCTWGYLRTSRRRAPTNSPVSHFDSPGSNTDTRRSVPLALQARRAHAPRWRESVQPSQQREFSAAMAPSTSKGPRGNSSHLGTLLHITELEANHAAAL
jgi:hypothetical protein